MLVEPDAMRVACPVRWRLDQVIPLLFHAPFVAEKEPNRGVIWSFYPMVFAPEGGRHGNSLE